MQSSPSNPKHKLRIHNVMGKKKLKRRKKNKCHEKILIEKLKEFTLSTKNETMQERMQ